MGVARYWRVFLRSVCALHSLYPCHWTCSFMYHFNYVLEHAPLQPFRRYVSIAHITISVLPGTNLHLSEVKDVMVEAHIFYLIVSHTIYLCMFLIIMNEHDRTQNPFLTQYTNYYALAILVNVCNCFIYGICNKLYIVLFEWQAKDCMYTCTCTSKSVQCPTTRPVIQNYWASGVVWFSVLVFRDLFWRN